MTERELDPEVQKKISAEPDFIAVRHCGHSLKALMAKYPDGVPLHVEARAMERSEEYLRALYATTIRKLRRLMRVVKE